MLALLLIIVVICQLFVTPVVSSSRSNNNNNNNNNNVFNTSSSQTIIEEGEKNNNNSSVSTTTTNITNDTSIYLQTELSEYYSWVNKINEEEEESNSSFVSTTTDATNTILLQTEGGSEHDFSWINNINKEEDNEEEGKKNSSVSSSTTYNFSFTNSSSTSTTSTTINDANIKKEAAVAPLPRSVLWNTLLLIGCTITFVISLLFVISIVCNKNIGKQSYNIYIVFLTIPDAALNGVMALLSLYRLVVTKSMATPSFVFFAVQWIVLFYQYSNTLLNAVIAREVYKLVEKSYRRMPRVRPPSTSTVYCQIAMVYAFASFMATWCIFPTSYALITYSTSVYNDGTTTPFVVGLGSKVFPTDAAALIIAIPIVLPVVQVLYVNIDVYKNRLLPRSGRTRTVWKYFSRILMIFLLFYVPSWVLSLVFAKNTESMNGGVVHTMLGFLYILQALVNIYLAMQKDDIGKAFRNLIQSIFCCFINSNKTNKNKNTAHTGNRQNINKEKTKKRLSRCMSMMMTRATTTKTTSTTEQNTNKYDNDKENVVIVDVNKNNNNNNKEVVGNTPTANKIDNYDNNKNEMMKKERDDDDVDETAAVLDIDVSTVNEWEASNVYEEEDPDHDNNINNNNNDNNPPSSDELV